MSAAIMRDISLAIPFKLTVNFLITKKKKKKKSFDQKKNVTLIYKICTNQQLSGKSYDLMCSRAHNHQFPGLKKKKRF